MIVFVVLVCGIWLPAGLIRCMLPRSEQGRLLRAVLIQVSVAVCLNLGLVLAGVPRRWSFHERFSAWDDLNPILAAQMPIRFPIILALASCLVGCHCSRSPGRHAPVVALQLSTDSTSRERRTFDVQTGGSYEVMAWLERRPGPYSPPLVADKTRFVLAGLLEITDAAGRTLVSHRFHEEIRRGTEGLTLFTFPRRRLGKQGPYTLSLELELDAAFRAEFSEVRVTVARMPFFLVD